MRKPVLSFTGLNYPAPGWDRKLFQAYSVKSVLDVGANNGGFIPAWLDSGATYVHAIEPIPSFYEKITERFKDDPRVVCYQLAVSDRTESLQQVNVFNCYTLMPDGAKQLDRALEFQKEPPFDVVAHAIDDLLQEWSFSPDFIKIDVDGYDVKALRGARRFIAHRLPLMMLEMSYLPAVLGDCYECEIRWLYKLGYTFTHINGGQHYPTERDFMTVFPWNTSFDIIAEPPERA